MALVPHFTMVQNAFVSDLFFNHSHDRYHELFKRAGTEDDKPDPAELHAALMEDAREFSNAIKNAFGEVIEPALLVADFEGRV
jgi:hypothetical protein